MVDATSLAPRYAASVGVASMGVAAVACSAGVAWSPVVPGAGVAGAEVAGAGVTGAAGVVGAVADAAAAAAAVPAADEADVVVTGAGERRTSALSMGMMSVCSACTLRSAPVVGSMNSRKKCSSTARCSPVE